MNIWLIGDLYLKEIKPEIIFIKRHLDAMEYECGMGESDDPYIDSSIRDRYNLINVTVAAVNKSSDVNIPNVLLPLSSLDNDTGHKWRIFAATYSFSDLGLAVPGEESIREELRNIC